MNKFAFISRSVCASVAIVGFIALAANAPSRQPDESVDNADLRQRQGLHPDKNLLFNGWGVTPAGKQVMVSDLALKMIFPSRLTEDESSRRTAGLITKE